MLGSQTEQCCWGHGDVGQDFGGLDADAISNTLDLHCGGESGYPDFNCMVFLVSESDVSGHPERMKSSFSPRGIRDSM